MTKYICSVCSRYEFRLILWYWNKYIWNFKNENVFYMCVLYFPDGVNAIKVKLDVCRYTFYAVRPFTFTARFAITRTYLKIE